MNLRAYVSGHFVGLRGHPPDVRKGKVIVYWALTGISPAALFLLTCLSTQHYGGRHVRKNLGGRSL